jgi:hypothetical protein
MPPSVRFVDALEVLGRHRVRFIVVGGVAAVLGGAPVSTFDLDIVHDRGRAIGGRVARWGLARVRRVRGQLALQFLDSRPQSRIVREQGRQLALQRRDALVGRAHTNARSRRDPDVDPRHAGEIRTTP